MTTTDKAKRKAYKPEFKSQIVELYKKGKKKADIIREYELSPSMLDRWIRQSDTSGSFKEKDNRTEEQNRLIQLEKENKQLRMENDILKQAALIMGRR